MTSCFFPSHSADLGATEPPRELRRRGLVESVDVATIGSVTTVVLALASALALTFLGAV